MPLRSSLRRPTRSKASAVFRLRGCFGKLLRGSSPPLKTLLEQTLTDRRCDFTYLGMQVIIEGLALAAFQRMRDNAKNQLAAAVNAYVMQDEARHVAFGRMALRDLYPQLSDAERAER